MAGAVLCLLAAPHPALAKWTITPTATLQGAYSDNVNLAATGEQDDYIVSAIGQISAAGEMPRLESYIDYTLSYDTYGSTSGLDGERHALSTRNKASIVSDFLFFNLNGDITERETSRNVVTPTNSRTFGGGQTRVTSINVGPELRTTIGSGVELTANVEYSYVNFSDTSVGTGSGAFSDGEIWRGDFRISNLGSGETFTWALSGSGWDDNVGRSNFDGLVTAQYLISLSLAAVGRIGYDAADTDGDGVNDIETEHWRLGLEYRPSSRTMMRFEAGQRFNEASYDAEILHQLKRFGTFFASYSHVLQTDVLRFATDSDLELFDEFNNPIPIADIIQDLNNSTFVSKTGTIGLNGETGLMSYSLSGYYREREFQNLPGQDTIVGGSIDLTRNFGSQFYASANLSMSVDDRPNPAQEVDRVRGNFALGYKISSTASAQLGIGFQKNEFGTGTEVNETVVSFLITKSW